MRHKRIAIIGGGITGLAAAYDLARVGNNHGETEGTETNITIYESNPFLGGLAAGFKGRPEWDWPLEHYYHHLFTNDDAILDLTEELGFSDSLDIHRPTTAIHHQGKNFPLDSVTRVLTFPLIPLVDRIRMGMAIAYLRFHSRPPWRQFDRMLAHEWARRWMGRKAYEAAWEFQLQGKFGQHYKSVNMAWLWARVYKRTPKLGYYRGGFQAFIDRLAQSVQQRGVTIHLNVPISAITPQNEGEFILTSPNHPPATYDVVLSTVSPGLMQQMVSALPDHYLSQLKKLKSMGAVVVTVALDRQLTEDMYWISLPKHEGVPLLALIEHTNMIDPAHYGGDHLIYLGDYLDPDHRFFELSIDELLDELLPHLTRFNPDFERSWVTGAWVHRVKYAQPVPPVGYLEMIPNIRTPLPGLYFASMSQVYPWDRGTNYAVKMGRKVAKMIENDR